MPVKDRVIRDPIYGYISLPGPLAVVVDHPLYQRMRRVGQTSLTSAVYPTATGTRFEHGLGAMHLAMRGFRAAWANAHADAARDLLGAVAASDLVPRRLVANSDELIRLLEIAVGGCALLHDVGHPPFSHVLEPLYAELVDEHFAGNPELGQSWEDSGRPYHEFAGIRLARQMVQDVRPKPLDELIVAILEADENGSGWMDVLHAIVAGEVDVDRLDYVMRDAQKAGTEFGAIDYVRLIDALELHTVSGGFRIAPGVRARSAVETLLLQRTQAYKWITYHPRVVGANLALLRAVEALRRLSLSNDTFGAGGELHEAQAVFAWLWPNLNYVFPAERDLQAHLPLIGSGVAAAGRGPDQLSLAEQEEAALATRFRVDMQAAVDDGAVLQALKSGGIAAQILLETGSPSPALRDDLVRMLTVQHHALWRRKNCLPAWKTVDEFQTSAAEMRHDLEDAVRNAYDEVLAGRLGEVEAVAAALEAQRDDWLSQLQSEPVITTNRLITTLFDGEPAYLDQFATTLSSVRSRLEAAPGFWDVAYTGFTSVRHGDEAAVLFDGEEELRLVESSTLAQALERVEESRFRLCAFFFTSYPANLPISEDVDARELREKLAGDVVSAFPSFVRRVLPDVIRDSFSAD